MGALADECQLLLQALSEAGQYCQIIRQEIEVFSNKVCSQTLEMVKLRLLFINLHIVTKASAILEQHDGKGYALVMITSHGMGIFWSEKEYSPEDRKMARAHDVLIVSPQEVCAYIEDLKEKLDSGKWEQVIDWINRYGTTLVS